MMKRITLPPCATAEAMAARGWRELQEVKRSLIKP